MGLWNWLLVRGNRSRFDRVFHGGDVSLLRFSCNLFSRPFRMYDRTIKPIPQRPSTGLRYRIETLVGITGIKMAKYRTSWYETILSPLNVVWRPHLLGILLFEVDSHICSALTVTLIPSSGNVIWFQYWYQCTPQLLHPVLDWMNVINGC